MAGVSSSGTGALELSDSGGGSWKSVAIPGATALVPPYLSAIDPADPDRLYIRLRGDTRDTLLVTADAGVHFTDAFDASASLDGFALSPDGSRVVVGGPADGVWVADRGALPFTRASTVGVRCLAWTAAGLYACGAETGTGFTVGVSIDSGSTFSHLLDQADIAGPLACAASTSVGAACPSLWPALRCQIGVEACDAAASPGKVGITEGAAASGCACRCVPRSSTGAAYWTILAFIVAASGRRSRRRSTRGRKGGTH